MASRLENQYNESIFCNYYNNQNIDQATLKGRNFPCTLTHMLCDLGHMTQQINLTLLNYMYFSS